VNGTHFNLIAFLFLYIVKVMIFFILKYHYFNIVGVEQCLIKLKKKSVYKCLSFLNQNLSFTDYFKEMRGAEENLLRHFI